MKLYTEEDILSMLRSFHNLEINVQLSMTKLTPIEILILSDNDIESLAKDYILYNDSKRQWVIEGMKLYREQLKRLNKFNTKQ
jgi:hypothetical protein